METPEQTFHRMCRACMSSDQYFNSIYDYAGNPLKISEMLATTIPQLLVQSSDQLPKLICLTCLNKLNIAFQFQRMCIASDKHMRSLLGDKDCVDLENNVKVEQLEQPTKTRRNALCLDEDPLLGEELIKVQSWLKIEINEDEVKDFDLGKLLAEQPESAVKSLVEDDDSAQGLDAEWSESDKTIEEETVKEKLRCTRSQTGTKRTTKEQPSTSNMHNETGVDEIEKPRLNNRRKDMLPCPHCDKAFDSPYRLKRHAGVHSLTREFQCETCNYRFVTINQLARHKLMHATDPQPLPPPEGFKCTECPRRFEKRESLSAHAQTHRKAEPNKVFKCDLCPKTFRKFISRTKHERTHPENKKLKCSLCEKTFALNAHLNEHMNKHNGLKPYVCVYCNKAFHHNVALKEHQRIHAGDKPYMCAQCGKCFKVANTLRQHQLRHVDGKAYQCLECPSRFTCQNNLTKHSYTHRSTAPHICDICGSKFTRSYTLKKHMFKHSGQRPHKCEQCNMTFVFIYCLQRHMRTHTGEKPYKCKYCDRDYAESGDLNKHMRTHVGKKTYICDQCPAAFKYKTELRDHQIQHYKEQQQDAGEITQEMSASTTEI